MSSPSQRRGHQAQQDQVIMQEPKAQPLVAQLLKNEHTMDQSCLGESQAVSSPAEEQPCPFEFRTLETSNTRETKAQDIS